MQKLKSDNPSNKLKKNLKEQGIDTPEDSEEDDVVDKVEIKT